MDPSKTLGAKIIEGQNPTSETQFSLRPALCFALALVILSPGCLHRHKKVGVSRPPTPPSVPHRAGLETANAPQPARAPAAIVQGEEGVASWYGRPYHGRRTANGEIYNMYAISAAHRTLPFGTQVRVHDLDSGLNVVVRINDRGPFVEGRIIDLSYAAAQAINMAGPGTARVRLEIMGYEPGAVEPGIFAVQVGAFRERGNAERLKAKIAAQFPPVIIQSFDRGDGMYHRVRVGRAASESAARALAGNLRAANLATETFVVRLN